MGYHLTTDDDVEAAHSLPPAQTAKYTLCLRKPTRGPIFIWVLSTKYTDGETGLLYYGLRYYQPEIGRWTSRDPTEEDGGANIFEYGRNDAISMLDALGMKAIRWVHVYDKATMTEIFDEKGISIQFIMSGGGFSGMFPVATALPDAPSAGSQTLCTAQIMVTITGEQGDGEQGDRLEWHLVKGIMFLPCNCFDAECRRISGEVY